MKTSIVLFVVSVIVALGVGWMWGANLRPVEANDDRDFIILLGELAESTDRIRRVSRGTAYEQETHRQITDETLTVFILAGQKYRLEK